MRIGLLIYGDLDTLSGGYLYDGKLVSYLREAGDTVEIFSLPRRSYWRELGGNADLDGLAHARLDVLIQDELVHPAVYRMNRRRGRQWGFPVVALVHLLSTFAQFPFYKALVCRQVERRYLHSVDGLILNSQNTLQQCRGLLGNDLPPHIVAVPAGNRFSPAGVTPRQLQERVSGNRPLKILFAGNVIRQKGLDVLIRALRELPREDFRLTVAGRTDMEPRYIKKVRKLIQDCRLENQVTLCGPLMADDLARLYQNHHVLVMPSVHEAYGIVYVEAQQFGVPAIGTTAGGAREIITHGEDGFLIAPGDSTRLASILRQLHGDPGHLLDLSRNALDAFHRHPTWEDTGAAVRQFLGELVSPAGGLR